MTMIVSMATVVLITPAYATTSGMESAVTRLHVFHLMVA